MFKNAWFIASKDVMFQLKERSTLIWLFLMPLIFFYFIGTITSGGGGFFNQTTPLAIEATDDDFLAQELIKRMSSNNFEVSLLEALAEDEAPDQRLVIPSTFTESVLNGTPSTVSFIAQQTGLSFDYDTLKATRAVYTLLADIAVLNESGEALSAEGFEQLDTIPRSITLAVTTGGQRQEIPTGFEQAIPGTMVLFTLLILLTTGSVTLFIEREQGKLRRLATTPMTRGSITLGKWGGKMALGLVQIAFAMLAGTLLFRMNWGPDVGMVLIVMFCWGAFCASASILLANLGRNQGEVSGIGLMTSMMLAALGGAWWPIEVTPEWMQTLQKLLPSGWTMDAMHKLISFEAGALSVLPHLAALLIGTLFIGWIGTRRFKFQ